MPHRAIKVGARIPFLGKGAKQVFMGKCVLPRLAGFYLLLLSLKPCVHAQTVASTNLINDRHSEEGYYWEVST